MESKPMDLPQEWQEKIESSAKYISGHQPDEDSTPFRNGMYSGYKSGAMAYALWLYTCQESYKELKTKYDNILATESGHESKTENVWQSGYASGHEAGQGKAAKATEEWCNKWAKKNEENRILRSRADRMEQALKEIEDSDYPITQKELEDWLLFAKRTARKAIPWHKKEGVIYIDETGESTEQI